MAAHKAADLHLKLLSICLDSLNRDPADRRKSPCATDPQASLSLRVKIDQSLSFQNTAVQSYCSQKSDLLVYSDQHLQSRMSDGLAFQKSKAVCHRDAVVAAESCSICGNISILYGNIQSILCKVMLHIRSLFAYHIHMSLDNDSRRVFIACCSRFVDHYIVQFILYIRKVVFLCKVYQIITDLFCVS